MVQTALPELGEFFVESPTNAADLGLGDPRRCTERLDQVVHLAGRDAVDVGLHHHRIEGPVDAPPALEEGGEEAAFAELGDRELEVTRRCGEQAGPVPVALGDAVLAPLVGSRSDQGCGLGLDQLLEDPLEAGPDPLVEFTCFERVEQRGQVRLSKGHRCSPLVFWLEHVEDHAGGPSMWWTLTDLHHYWGRPLAVLVVSSAQLILSRPRYQSDSATLTSDSKSETA